MNSNPVTPLTAEKAKEMVLAERPQAVIYRSKDIGIGEFYRVFDQWFEEPKCISGSFATPEEAWIDAASKLSAKIEAAPYETTHLWGASISETKCGLSTQVLRLTPRLDEVTCAACKSGVSPHPERGESESEPSEEESRLMYIIVDLNDKITVLEAASKSSGEPAKLPPLPKYRPDWDGDKAQFELRHRRDQLLAAQSRFATLEAENQRLREELQRVYSLVTHWHSETEKAEVELPRLKQEWPKDQEVHQ